MGRIAPPVADTLLCRSARWQSEGRRGIAPALGRSASPRPESWRNHSVREVIDFFPSREEAEESLKQVLQDEPGWAGVLEVVEVELGSPPEN